MTWFVEQAFATKKVSAELQIQWLVAIKAIKSAFKLKRLLADAILDNTALSLTG